MTKGSSILFSIILIAFVCITSSFNKPVSSPEPAVVPNSKIEWLTWEQAVERMKKEPRKVLIDIYTDWCGWCKRMDVTTFEDPKIVKYVNDNFYAIKLDAEQKEDVIYDNHTFKFVPNGSRGAHELAATLLDNSMSYPSFVVMDETMKRIMIIKGFQKTEDLLPILHFTAKDEYKTSTYEKYKLDFKE